MKTQITISDLAIGEFIPALKLSVLKGSGALRTLSPMAIPQCAGALYGLNFCNETKTADAFLQIIHIPQHDSDGKFTAFAGIIVCFLEAVPGEHLKYRPCLPEAGAKYRFSPKAGEPSLGYLQPAPAPVVAEPVAEPIAEPVRSSETITATQAVVSFEDRLSHSTQPTILRGKDNDPVPAGEGMLVHCTFMQDGRLACNQVVALIEDAHGDAWVYDVEISTELDTVHRVGRLFRKDDVLRLFDLSEVEEAFEESRPYVCNTPGTRSYFIFRPCTRADLYHHSS